MLFELILLFMYSPAAASDVKKTCSLVKETVLELPVNIASITKELKATESVASSSKRISGCRGSEMIDGM